MSRRPFCRFFLENNSATWYFVYENFAKFFSSHNIDKEIRGVINSTQYESHVVENTTSVGSGLEAVIHVHYRPWRLSNQNQDTLNEMNTSDMYKWQKHHNKSFHVSSIAPQILLHVVRVTMKTSELCAKLTIDSTP